MVVALAIGSGAAVAANLRLGEPRRAIDVAGLSATLRVLADRMGMLQAV